MQAPLTPTAQGRGTTRFPLAQPGQTFFGWSSTGKDLHLAHLSGDLSVTSCTIMASRTRNRLPVWDDAASSNGSATPSTTRSAPSSQATAARSSRHALLKSSARFLQEVQSQWPAVPPVEINRPSIHTLDSSGRLANGNDTRSLEKTRAVSSASSYRSVSSRLAPRDALPVPRGAPTRSVSSSHLTSAVSQNKSASDKDKDKVHNRLSVASSFIHRDSEALEELLLEHETVAHGIRQQASHDSLGSSYTVSAPQNKPQKLDTKGASPATQVSTYEAEAFPQEEPDAVPAPRRASTTHTASPARVKTTAQPTGSRRASVRQASASASHSNGSTPLSPICSVHSGISRPDSSTPRSEDSSLVPLIPALLTTELPSQADLTAASPLERFAILAGLFSAMVKGSQTSVQQFGNKTVRLKRELRARLEEIKRHESRR